jgi:hypothetical protein
VASSGLLSPPTLDHLAVSLNVAAGRQQLQPAGTGLELADRARRDPDRVERAKLNDVV